MIKLLSPYRFFFICVYFILLLSTLRFGTFISLWFSIEFLTLAFIGIAFSFVSTRLSSLIILFIIQASSSLAILASYLLNVPAFFSIFLLLKLGMFPFISWFISSVVFLPSLLLGILRTAQKLPPFLIIFIFETIWTPGILWLSSLLGLITLPLRIFRLSNYRVFLVLSSICNNSWLFLSQIVSFSVFILFLVTYSVNFLILLTFFNKNLGLPTSKTMYKPSFPLMLCLLSLRGLPPFPIFFVKLFCLFGVKLSLFSLSHITLFILVSNSFLVIAYLKFILSLFLSLFSFSLLTF